MDDLLKRENQKNHQIHANITLLREYEKQIQRKVNMQVLFIPFMLNHLTKSCVEHILGGLIKKPSNFIRKY